MKKILKAVFLMLLSLCLCGCKIVKFAENFIESITAPTYNELSEEAENLSLKAFEALSNRDSETLCDLFCAENKNENLPETIDVLFDYVNGNIQSYGENKQYHLPIHFVSDSATYSIERFRFDNVVTDENKTYSVMFYIGIGNDDNSDYIGLQSIVLYENEISDENKLCRVGSCAEHFITQNVPTSYTDVDYNALFSSEIIKNLTLNLLYYLQENDKEGFVSLFAEEQKSSAEKYFDDIINLIGGNMETFSRIDCDNSGGLYKYDHYEEMSGSSGAYDIMNDCGIMFEIEYGADFINLTNPLLQGINRFSIKMVENDINDELEHDVISEIRF